VKALQAVHSHENPASAGRFDDRAELHESFYHLLLGCVVVGWIRLQEGQRGAEGDGLGNELARADTCLCPPLGNLPDGSPGPFAWGKKAHRRSIQLRCSDQLQTKLEGGQPHAESLSTSGKGSGVPKRLVPFPPQA
jgi:hypothetical protein